MKICELECSTASELVGYLRVSHPIWREARFGELAFRGQAKTDWKLVPVAFRDTARFGYRNKVISPPIPNALLQAEAEHLAVIEFLRLADGVGLHVPGDSQLLRGGQSRSQITERWPPDEVLETLAIAQHHGVPTRLLDFTYDPLVAAFHAAKDVIRLGLHNSTEQSSKARFAVWSIDLRFVRLAWEYPPKGSDRIREVTVPRASNPYLHAQHGLFLLDNAAGGTYSAIEDVICERGEFWQNRAGFWPPTSPPSKLLPPVTKIEIPWTQAVEVIRCLHQEGKTLAHLTPSFDGVVNALTMIRELALDREG